MHVNYLIQLSAVRVGDLDELLGSCELLSNFVQLFDGNGIVFVVHVKTWIMVVNSTFS